MVAGELCKGLVGEPYYGKQERATRTKEGAVHPAPLAEAAVASIPGGPTSVSPLRVEGLPTLPLP